MPDSKAKADQFHERLVRRIPENPRRPNLTVKPKPARRCVWQAIARIEAAMLRGVRS